MPEGQAYVLLGAIGVYTWIGLGVHTVQPQLTPGQGPGLPHDVVGAGILLGRARATHTCRAIWLWCWDIRMHGLSAALFPKSTATSPLVGSGNKQAEGGSRKRILASPVADELRNT